MKTYQYIIKYMAYEKHWINFINVKVSDSATRRDADIIMKKMLSKIQIMDCKCIVVDDPLCVLLSHDDICSETVIIRALKEL